MKRSVSATQDFVKSYAEKEILKVEESAIETQFVFRVQTTDIDTVFFYICGPKSNCIGS